MTAQVENKLRAILTLHSEGVRLEQFQPLLPTWRQFGDAKLKPFFKRFPNTAAVIRAGGAEWVVPARPLLLQTAKSGVTALLNRSPAKALDLDELVAAYAKQNHNANLDFVAELAGHKYVEDLLEEIGFVVVPNGERDTVTFRHGSAPSAQQPAPQPRLAQVVISATLQHAPNDSKLTLSLPVDAQPAAAPVAAQAAAPPTAKASAHGSVVQPSPVAVPTPAAAPKLASVGSAPAVVLVDTVEQCRKVVDEVLNHDHPLALDCEGVDLGDKGGRLCLVQIATKSGWCFLFDVEQAGSRLFSEGGLQRVLEDVHVLKVGHDLRADAAALFAQHGVFLNRTFDTQGAFLKFHFSACSNVRDLRGI